MKLLRRLRVLSESILETGNAVRRLEKGLGELRILVNDYLNRAHWCEAVVIGYDDNQTLIWLAQCGQVQEGGSVAIPLDVDQHMRVEAVVAQGPCVIEEFFIGNRLICRGGGRFVLTSRVVEPGVRLVVQLRGRLRS